MKKLSFILFLWAFMACNPADTAQVEIQAPNPVVFFKAKMNGSLWEAPRALTFKTNNETMLSITGRQAENAESARLISFRIPLSTKMGDNIEIVKGVDCQSHQSFASVIEDTPEKTMTNFESQTGKIVIKKHDIVAKHIEGSFSFIANGSRGSMTITEGAFSVDY